MMVKLYQIVDDEDRLVGHKQREAIDYKVDNYRIGALWLTNSKGEILLAQRVLTKDKDPGKWGPAAAGTLEKDETYESNIYKEAEEEIGIKDIKFTLGPKQRFLDPRKSFCQWFIGNIDKEAGDFKLQEDEVAQVKWVTKNWLANDLAKHPDRYVPSMATIIKLFDS